jgi:hypothetical protein
VFSALEHDFGMVSKLLENGLLVLWSRSASKPGGIAMSHSCATIANELRHRFRDDLNHAKHLRDIEDIFVLAVRKLLIESLDDSLIFTDQDINLTPAKDGGFELSSVIQDAEAFKTAARNSELLDVIARFAESAAHRKQSLEKHQETSLRPQEHHQH